MFKSRDKQNPFSILALLRCRTNVFAKRYRNRRKHTIDFNDDPVSSFEDEETEHHEDSSKAENLVAMKGQSSRSMLPRNDKANTSYTLHISERLMSENDLGDRDEWEWSMSGMSSIQREFNFSDKLGDLPHLTASMSYESESVSEPEADHRVEANCGQVKCPMKSDGAVCESINRANDAEAIQDDYSSTSIECSNDNYHDDTMSVSEVSTITALSFMTSYTSLTPDSRYLALKMKKRALERQIEQNLFRYSNQRIPSSIQVKTHS